MRIVTNSTNRLYTMSEAVEWIRPPAAFLPPTYRTLQSSNTTDPSVNNQLFGPSNIITLSRLRTEQEHQSAIEIANSIPTS